MRLKVACWICATFTVILLLGWPVFVGLPPKHASRVVLKEYALRAEFHFFALILYFLLTTVFAALVVRQTRQEYIAESADNLRALIEGTLEDHRKKSESESDPTG